MFDIPIIINNRNRLATTRQLANKLRELGYTNIHILDNASTYHHLRLWLEECPYHVKFLKDNLGQLAIYNSDYINNFQGWVVYSDSDIMLGENTPSDFIQVMINLAEKYTYSKVGLALRIDDLPDTEYGNYIKLHEQKYWNNEVEKDVYIAHVDTTFSIIRVGQPFTYSSLRAAGNLTAIHVPWYLDYDNLSEEEQYVIEHSDSQFSTTKRFYNSTIKTEQL